MIVKTIKKGMALITTAIIGVIFLIITTGALYLTIVNSESTRVQKIRTKLNSSVISGLELALGKIQRYFYDSSLNKYKPILHFHNSKQKREELINTDGDPPLSETLPSGTDINNLLLNLPISLYGSLQDNINIGKLRSIPGEKYFAPANFYKTELISEGSGNNTLTPLLYSINHDNSSWIQNANNPAQSTYTYLVEAITKDNLSGEWQGAIADVEVTRFSLSGYGIFYADDLEILPGPDMIFNGKVHSNKNIYLGGPLTFNSTLHSAGHIYVGRKDTNGTGGNVRIKNPITGNLVQMTQSNDSIQALSGFSSHHLADTKYGDGINNPPSNPTDTWKVDPNWQNNAKSLWGEAVKDKVHGVKEMPKPDVKSIDRGGFYEQNAGIKVITKTQGTEGIPNQANSFNNYKEIIEMTDKNGNLLYKKTINYTSSGTISSTTYDYISGDLKMTTGNVTCNTPSTCQTLVNTTNDPISTTWFMNGREVDNRTRKPVRTTNIDIKKLQNTDLWPSDGLVYASREDSVPDSDMLDGKNDIPTPDGNRKPYGIMLQNGKTLSKPINFVTNNPVYIRGDFNVHQKSDGTRLINPNNNNENVDFGKPGIDTWKPASIISDALNILSNSWNLSDYQNIYNPNPNRTASYTEVNATMVTGIVSTDRKLSSSASGTYSGGFENYPRFIENWSGKNFVMRGSFIQLWQSKFATGRQGYSFYSPPNRRWGFDRSYEIQNENLPAGFLDIVPATTEFVKIRNIKLVKVTDTNIYKALKSINDGNKTNLKNTLKNDFNLDVEEILGLKNNSPSNPNGD